MFTCVHNGAKGDPEGFGEAIINESMAGVDKSILTSSEIQQMPEDYIRQLCNLSPEDSCKLTTAFKERQKERYTYRCQMIAEGIETDLKMALKNYELSKLIKDVRRRADIASYLDTR